MSELFGDFKRPKAEKRVIDKIITLLEESKILFKNKNYLEALNGYQEAYQLLLDIWDIYPKIITLYIMMKGYFYSKKYKECSATIDMLEPMLEYIPKNKLEIFIKIKSKILMYQTILFFIFDEIDKSIDSVMDMIKYLTNHPTFNLENKAKFFWNYIKSFIKITALDKSNKFLLLKENYDSMIVEQVNLNEEKNEQDEPVPVKKVNRGMVEAYKSFMNYKLRGIVYELLDKEFYYVKYHKINDKVMIFLHKNMTIFVRDNNRGKLVEIFHTFIVLNKMNLKKEYNMTLDELVYEQKRRIEAFDRIYSNLVGAFNHIFKPYFADEMLNITNKMKRRDSKIKSFRFNITELKNMIKVRIKSPSNWEEELTEEKDEKEYKKLKNNKKKKGHSLDYNFIKEIKIPPNTESMDKQILFDNFISRKNLINSTLKRNNRIQIINNYKPKKINITNDTFKNESNIKVNVNSTDYTLKLPNITSKNKLENIEEEKNYHKVNNKKKYKLKLVKKRKLDSELGSLSESIHKENNFKLRNINNYLITKILDIFLSLYNKEHNIQQENDKFLNLNIRKKDLFDFNIPNYINSFGAISQKGSQQENQDNYFYYDNYFLIKNLFIFGVLDGHGKHGKEISELISILFPSYFFYLLLDDNLYDRKVDINKEILKLMKIQEPPNDIKNMFILRYFFNKFEIDFSLIPFISGNQNVFLNQIHETLSYSHNELKKRYEIDINNSGTTLCSAFIQGNILYIVNVGDSRAVLGAYFYKINRWKTTQLSIDHKPKNPNENRRIISYNGRVDRLKNEYGDEYGPYRVFRKENDSTYPGLSISRTIGDEDAKKLGVTFEPELFRYELKENDKIIIIATDGLWELLSNEEAIKIVGDCMNNNMSCQQAAQILVDKAKKKIDKGHKLIKIKSKEFEDDYKSYLNDITCIIIYLNITL